MIQSNELEEKISPIDLIAPAGFRNEWRENVNDEQYHADKTAIGSSSIRLAMNSANAFYYDTFISKVVKDKKAFNYGKIVHQALLESMKFRSKYAVLPNFVGFTKTGEWTNSANSADVKRQRKEWYDSLPPGSIIVTEEERTQIITTIENIMKHEDGPLLLKDGRPEIAGYFRDEETGLRLKIKPDFLSFDCTRLVDIKTSRDIDERRFGSAAYGYRYDIQLYHYACGVKAITGKWPDTIWILAIENVAPFECNVIYLSMDQIDQAKDEYRNALKTIRTAIDTGKWPMRYTQASKLHTPFWFITKQTEGMGL